MYVHTTHMSENLWEKNAQFSPQIPASTTQTRVTRSKIKSINYTLKYKLILAGCV